LSLMLLVVIIGALVAIVVVTISRVQTHNSVLKLVRQYQGTLRIVDGSLLDFDAKMLDTKSTKFTERAAQIEQRIDALFDYSGLGSIYEGSTVTGFRFIVEVPALEVQFNIKTKVDVDLNVLDLLTIIRDSVRGKGFADATVDLASLTLEDQRLPTSDSPPNSPASTRKG
uniref:SEA domain-containing protein n=1 Tax=Plectus sambesii TaxID=2011161 RepID=A0A914V894_9BILA